MSCHVLTTRLKQCLAQQYLQPPLVYINATLIILHEESTRLSAALAPFFEFIIFYYLVFL